ncbi:MAG TPA: MFS transporter [Pseudonocardiaceae bacterium]|nr:MFS transporter [Pseudonocardiaceae bacterium]
MEDVDAQAAPTPARPVSRRRWGILAIGVASQAATSAFIYGLPFLVPNIRAAEHLSLAAVGVVVAAPTVGLLLTLIGWGAFSDRFGERLAITLGLAGCGISALVAILAVHGIVGFVLLIGLAGAFGSSVNVASGRAVMGWFAVHERGVAMSVRQMSQPLGVAFAAFSLPLLARGMPYRSALLLPTALCLACAVIGVLFLVDPPRPPTRPGVRNRSPYRSPVLWRLHSASAMLVVPQFTISAFGLVYLVSRQDWAAATAGAFMAAIQLAGAFGRLGSGYWSDRVGSRLRPMRQLALASAAVLLLAALGDVTWSWVVVFALAVGAVITVADNGLGYTATAEFAGSAWAGRALGTQNTAQNVTASLTPPVLGLIIGAHGYATAFACAAVCPLLAILLTPVRAETGFREWV